MRDLPCGPAVKKPLLPMQEVQVLSLLRELRSHMLWDVAKKKQMKLNMQLE